MGFGKPREVYRPQEAPHVRRIRQHLQEIRDLAIAEGLTLPIKVRITEAGMVLDFTIDHEDVVG